MRKHLTIALALIVVLALVMSGCAQTPAASPTAAPAPTKAAEPTKAPEPTKAAEPTKPAAAPTTAAAPTGIKKVGLVTDVGKVDDKSFNESAWNGVQKAAKEFGFQASYIETQQPTDYDKNIAQFADEGFDVIVTVGFMLGDATKAAAAKYPNVKFIIVDSEYDPPISNVACLMFAEDQSGFLAGALAALMTKTNVIGGVYGKEIPPVIKFRKGYENGAALVNPKVKVLGTYIDSFTDPVKGGEVAKSQMAENADVIFGAGGKTGNGALIAAKQKGVYAIGVDTDQYYTLPEAKDVLISSAMKRVDVAVYTAIKSAVEGKFKGGTMLFTAANDGVGLAPFHDLDSKVPAEVKAKLNEIAKGLKDGSIKTNVKL
ncbi:MAG: BMP family lipoprotein [Chloroflexota bacterium]